MLDSLTYIPVALIAGLVLIGAFKGLRRGIARQTIRTVTVILSLVFSIIAAKSINSTIINNVSGMQAEEVLQMLEQYGISLGDSAQFLGYLDPSTLSYILAIPLGIIVAPVLFVLFFIVISGLLLIVHAIISGVLGFSKRRNSAATRLMGMGLGAIQGLAVAIIITVPFVGILSATSDVVAQMQAIENQPTLSADMPEGEESDEALNAVISAYNDYLKDYAESPYVKFAGTMGGNALYNNLSTVKIKGEKYPMVETVAEPVLTIYPNVTKLQGFDWQAPSTDQQAAIRNIIGAFDDSQYISNITTDLLSSVAKAYNDGAISMEMSPAMKSMVDVAINSLGNASADSFANTLYTISDAYFLLADEGILVAISENPEKAAELLGKKNEDGVTIIGQITGILGEDETTAEILGGVAEMSITMLAQQFGVEEAVVNEVYGKVKAGLYELLAIKRADYATVEEYTDVIASDLDAMLKENGLELDAEIIDSIADYIVQNHSDDIVVNDTHVNNIIFSYYDAYVANMVNDPNFPGISDNPDNLQ